jgi:hypothetical protein
MVMILKVDLVKSANPQLEIWGSKKNLTPPRICLEGQALRQATPSLT